MSRLTERLQAKEDRRDKSARSPFEFAADELKADPVMVMKVCKMMGQSLQWASKELQADRSIVMAAVKDEPSALQYADDSMKADREVVLLAVSTRLRSPDMVAASLEGRWVAEALAFANEKFRLDPEVILATLKTHEVKLGDQFDKNSTPHELWLAAIEKKAWLFRLVPHEYRQEREFVLAVARHDGLSALKYKGESLEVDYELALVACESNGDTYQHLPEKWKADRYIAIAALQSKHGAGVNNRRLWGDPVKNMPENLKTDPILISIWGPNQHFSPHYPFKLKHGDAVLQVVDMYKKLEKRNAELEQENASLKKNPTGTGGYATVS